MDNSEKRFESDIEEYLLSDGGYIKANLKNYDKKLAVDLSQMVAFIADSQPAVWKLFCERYGEKSQDALYRRFQQEVSSRGLISVLREGVSDTALRGKKLKFAYFMPSSALNEELVALYNKNILSCGRQFYYSEQNRNSVDMVLLLNGIPVVALELKNQQKGQDVSDGVKQWQTARDNRELVFRFDSRILVYFAVDLYNVQMATALNGENTFFMPFDQGSNGAGNVGGAGNPANAQGYVTSYLWEKFLSRDGLLALLQKYVSRQKERTYFLDKGKIKERESEKILFPRFHQYDVVEKSLADVLKNGTGKNYLIEHSAGSGKSNSIAWLVYRLSTLFDKNDKPVFDSVIVVTDRRILNAQLQDTIQSFTHKAGQIVTVKDGEPSSKLADAIADGVQIIVCTLFRFSVIFKEGKILKQAGKKFAVVVDEAHSSQSGESAQNLKTVLADTRGAEEEYAEIAEDDDFDSLDEEMLRQGQHDNQSFFAFTATPKPKTLQKFGQKQPDGTFRPFHVYSMKQAIEEGFILDVLKFYTTIENSFEIVNNTKDNPEVPELPTIKAIRDFQRSDEKTIEMKTKVIVEQFRQVTLSKMKVGGVSHAKAMVVTTSRKNAVQYFFAIRKYIEEKHYTDVLPLVAFSGSVVYGGEEVTEPKLNELTGAKISEEQLRYYFASDMFNMLIVADKYQTGFDEPCLHTMFVDKKLKGVKAVQTLSRLNRTCKKYGKTDTYILDFVNTKEDIQKAFEPFYTDTVLESEIDPNKLYDMKNEIDAFRLIDDEAIEAFAAAYDSIQKTGQKKNSQGILSSIIKPTVDRYNDLSEEKRGDYRKLLKSFTRFYAYVTQIIRIFDKQLHKFYLFAEWTFRQLPRDPKKVWNIDISVINNTLKETFSGSISLSGEENSFKPQPPHTGKSVKQMELLEVIIERINNAFGDNFTDGGKSIVRAMYDQMAKDAGGKLAKMVKNSDEEMFVKSIFPDYFAAKAGECYASQSDAFAQLFQDDDFYKVVMEQMARAMYQKFKK